MLIKLLTEARKGRENRTGNYGYLLQFNQTFRIGAFGTAINASDSEAKVQVQGQFGITALYLRTPRG